MPSFCLFTPQTASEARSGPGPSQEPETLTVASVWVQGPTYLSQLLLLSQVHWQGTGLEREQPILELVSTQDAGVAVVGELSH